MFSILRKILYALIIVLVIPTNIFAFDPETESVFNRNAYHYEPDACEDLGAGGGAGGGSGSVPLGGTNAERMFRFFVQEGLSEAQAAGITGNAMAESGETIDPMAANGSSYRGIFQWDTRVRWPRLVQWALSQNLSEDDFETQLKFAFQEATERGNIEGIKQQGSIELATWYWGRFFEVAIIGGSSETPLTNVQSLATRTSNAQNVYDQFAGTSGGGGGGGGGGASAAPGGITEAGATIALDPGHGAAIPNYTDGTGLVDRETDNSPEREDVLDVANRVKTQLEEAGFTIVMLRNTATEAVTKRQRVDLATQADAVMAVSIHTTGPETVNQVWPQRVGKYREYGSTRLTFGNEAVATLSEQYAGVMATSRTETEGHEVTTDPDQSQQSASFGRADLPSKGNISLLQLWSTDIPWVYNEITQDGPGASITDTTKQAYADGIANGVIEAAPGAVGDGSSGDDCSDSAGGGGTIDGGLSGAVTGYAWPTYTAAPYVEKKPEYQDAVERAQAAGLYVGGIIYPGVDCGGFVTRVMLDSGYEPNYNSAGRGGNVATGQTPWLQGNWESLGHVSDIAELEPGDVAINDGRSHTFLYVGEVEGFAEPVASSSLDERAPMAGEERPGSNIEWFRKR